MNVSWDSVQAWLDRYVEAWKSFEPSAIRDLFSEDAEYHYYPYDEPIRGAEAILKEWVEPGGDISRRDAPGTYDAHYEPWVVDGDRAVAIGHSRYWTDASRSQLAEVFDNCYLLRFDDDGRCSMFTEYFVKEPPAR
jgi:hypothetical protein